MAGLDPAIQTHSYFMKVGAWMRGSSPRMTARCHSSFFFSNVFNL